MQGNQALTCAGPLGGGHTPCRLVTEGRIRHSWVTWNHKGEGLLWLERPREFSKLTPIRTPQQTLCSFQTEFPKIQERGAQNKYNSKDTQKERTQRVSTHACCPGDTAASTREKPSQEKRNKREESRRHSHQPHVTIGCCNCSQG